MTNRLAAEALHKMRNVWGHKTPERNRTRPATRKLAGWKLKPFPPAAFRMLAAKRGALLA